MRAPDKVVGSVLLVSSVVLYIYYSIWVLLTPFFDEGHPIQDFFLPYHYAISVPAVLLVLLFTGAATFIGMVMIESREKKKWN
ncbi:dolichyl-phosphate mannosyltransferase polypeptide regulatory subunit [Plasmopara halstedii]|uniref:Dolichol phosphate-mannose biosynthesis regulatory protein n=1 Tax=Plasmopara halstedii TaxID=4781 RepID=A0A0P1AD60_PLAHL|nr:dolichyl-phosphate mannosyltransferase polypeptide regulatory subunit [Plasmopara halstedii]CEG38280.1 dolichyl-phosphate mannosyltransferase polypeptide regulatory subunit [Plasmopara halstedii]|eukprot:XP_024574649.1 dolichyl-phosphate mannosyltransferase polypeptide regulatory subunit [Plasmopara halstedii]